LSLDDVDLLGKCDFRRNVEIYNESFHPGTREWLSKKVDRWFQQRDSNSQVMILTADAGFGKVRLLVKFVRSIRKESS
jgi:hypothetical protein